MVAVSLMAGGAEVRAYDVTIVDFGHGLPASP